MNPELTPFQRRYVSYVKRCDELERKLRYFTQEIEKFDNGPGPVPRAALSNNGKTVAFTCPASYFPVVFSAEHSKYACTEDIAAYMRFPCQDSNTCIVDFEMNLDCPNGLPDGFPGSTADANAFTAI